ncbi:N-acetyltransferase [Maribacter sp. 2308TA10-17]|uniref:N-acetyltransferase n=1 Tax=Maribacter sp. 2308TA10-17 TaxID=3386276 RepID=UPI0039BC66C4
METIPLVQNTVNGKFFYELQINNHKAFIEYHIFSDDLLLLISSGVTQNLPNHHQVRDALIERVLDRIRRTNFKVISYCPSINKFVNKNKQYRNMIISNQLLSEVS